MLSAIRFSIILPAFQAYQFGNDIIIIEITDQPFRLYQSRGHIPQPKLFRKQFVVINMETLSLDRFLEAQEHDYHTALQEIKSGRKRSHWMWYIFPQMVGLGRTRAAIFYGIRDLNEAREYLQHPTLGPRLIRITKALLELPSAAPHQVLGSPDDLKLKSSMTLFSRVEGADPVFESVLKKFYDGTSDELTEKLIS